MYACVKYLAHNMAAYVQKYHTKIEVVGCTLPKPLMSEADVTM